jgi:hypothetical protein
MARVAMRIVPVRRGRPGRAAAHVRRPWRGGLPRGRWPADWAGLALGIGRAAMAAARHGHDSRATALSSPPGMVWGRYDVRGATLDAG